MATPEAKERERQQFTNLFVDSLILLTKNNILSEDVTKVDGTIGITLAGGDVFLINLRDAYESRKNQAEALSASDSPRVAFVQQGVDASPEDEGEEEEEEEEEVVPRRRRSKKRKIKEEQYEDGYSPGEEAMDNIFESSELGDYSMDYGGESLPMESMTESATPTPKPRGRPPRIKQLLLQADEDYVNSEVDQDYKEFKISQRVYQKIKSGEVKLRAGNIFVWKYFEDLGETKSICLSCKATVQLNDRYDRETMWEHTLNCDQITAEEKEKIPNLKDSEKMKAVKHQVWGRTFRSKVWNYFQRPPGKALCLMCNNMVLKGHDGNVRTLWNHIKKCPAINDSLELQEQPSIADETSLDMDDSQPTPKLVGKAMGRHRSSKVWNYFKILPDTISICKFCQSTLPLQPGEQSESLSSLWDHLTDMCPNVRDEDRPELNTQREAERMKILKWKTFGRQFKSQVWDYFEKPPGKAKCIFCNKLLNRGVAGNTTNLWNHVHSCNKVDEETRLEVEGVDVAGGEKYLCDMCSFTTYFQTSLKRHIERHDRTAQTTSVRGRGRGRGRPPIKHRFLTSRVAANNVKMEESEAVTLYTTDGSSFIDGNTFVQSNMEGLGQREPVYIQLHGSQADSMEISPEFIEVHVDQNYTEIPNSSESVVMPMQVSSADYKTSVSSIQPLEVTVEDETFVCHPCGNHYTLKEDLLEHVKKVHNIEYDDVQ